MRARSMRAFLSDGRIESENHQFGDDGIMQNVRERVIAGWFRAVSVQPVAIVVDCWGDVVMRCDDDAETLMMGAPQSQIIRQIRMHRNGKYSICVNVCVFFYKYKLTRASETTCRELSVSS